LRVVLLYRFGLSTFYLCDKHFFFASSGKKDNRFFAIDWILMIIQQQARLLFIRIKQDMRYFLLILAFCCASPKV